MKQIKVNSKWQIVIPKEFRKKLSMKPGTKVMVGKDDGILFIVPVPKDHLKAVKGP